MMEPSPIGVLLMTFGTASSPEDIPAYLASVRGGRPAPDDLVAEFQRRFKQIGGSPLIRITQEQAQAVEAHLNVGSAQRWVVLPGMRHSNPKIADSLAGLQQRGARKVIAVILAPQQSPITMAGYHRAVDEAASASGSDLSVKIGGAWHDVPAFLDALALKTSDVLASMPEEHRSRIAVVFTAHSLPKVVADKEPEYIQMLRDTAVEVARRARIPDSRWQFAYQSAGHTPQEWLKPDIKDLFPALKHQGFTCAVVVPVQFLSDHLEVLYDIDIEAKAEAKVAGLELRRSESLNTTPRFIEALGHVVQRELQTH